MVKKFKKLSSFWNLGLKLLLIPLLLPSLHAINAGEEMERNNENSNNNDLTDEPYFIGSIPNVTVPLGREAKIPCMVQNLGSHRVAWLRVESKTILTIHQHIITRNYRIGLSHSDDRQWNLHINNVEESDRGGYMCQINTVPMKYQVGYLDVVVPPDINTFETSADVMVRENMNVTLTCRAKGYPKPRITWRREDGISIEHGNWQEKKLDGFESTETLEGETITITKVSRLHSGAYLCIASNGVPPSVSKRIILNVHFPPMIWVPNQLIGAPIGGEVLLVCNTEAFPISINYWTKDDDEALMPNSKYEITNTEKSYKTHMILRIKDLEANDFGTYRCFAKNALGSTEGSIKLYEVHISGGKSGARSDPLNARILSSSGGSKIRQKQSNGDGDSSNAEVHNSGSISHNHSGGSNDENSSSSAFQFKRKCFDSVFKLNNLLWILTSQLFLLINYWKITGR